MQNDLIIEKSYGIYALEKILGDTGFSQTFLAYRSDDPDKTLYTLRRTRRKLSSDEQYSRYFRFLMKVLSLLSHPAIPPIIDHGQINGLFFTVRKYIKGYSLSEMIDHALRGNVRLGQEVVLAFFSQLIDVLDYSNNVNVTDKKKGITHSNISTTNFIIDNTGQLYVTDFRPPFTRPDLLREFNIMALDRMSPQMAQNKSVLEDSDVYQAGLLLYELVYFEPFLKNIDGAEKLNSELRRKIPIKNDPNAGFPPHINHMIAKLIDVFDVQHLVNFSTMADLFRTEWKLPTIEQSKQILSDYYGQVSQDQVHDIIEDFKEEIEDTLDAINIEDPLIEVEPEKQPVQTIQSATDERETGPEGPKPTQTAPCLDYKALGIQQYVSLLKSIRETLKIKPTNLELIKSAYDTLEKMRMHYQISQHLHRAESARAKGDTIDEIVNYLLVLSIEKENGTALAMLQQYAGHVTESQDSKTQKEEKTLHSALEYFQKKQYHDAISLLDTIPRSSTLFRQVKELKDKAIKIIDQQVEMQFAYQQGMKYLEDSHYELAIQELTKVLMGEPGHIQAIEAIEKAQAKLIEQQQVIQRLFDDASVAAKTGFFQKAIDTWQRILGLDPDNQQAQDYIYEMQQAVQKRDTTIQAHADKANAFLEVERYDKAIEEWATILELDPERTEYSAKIEQTRLLIAKSVQSEAVPVIHEEYESPEEEKEAVRFEQIETEEPETTPVDLSSDELETIEEIEEIEDIQEVVIGSDDGDSTHILSDSLPQMASEKSQLDHTQGPDVQGDETARFPGPDEAITSVTPDQSTIRQLLEQGLQEYGDGHFHSAIETWSKVLELDSHHEQALEYIELAREEVEQIEESPISPETVQEATTALPMGNTPLPDVDRNAIEQVELSLEDSTPEFAPTEYEEVIDQDTSETDGYSLPRTERPATGEDLAIEHDEELPELELDEPITLESDHIEILEDYAELPSESRTVTTDAADTVVEDSLDVEGYDTGAQATTGPDKIAFVEELPSTAEIRETKFTPAVEKTGASVDDVEDIFQRGFSAFERGDFDTAINEWNRVLSLNPNHTKTKILLVKAQKKRMEEQGPVKAEPSKGVELKTSPKKLMFGIIGLALCLILTGVAYWGWSSYSTSRNKTLGSQYFTEGKYDQAVLHFQRYLDKQPNDLIALGKLGESYLKIEKYQQALAALTKIKNPPSETRTLLAEAYVRSGNNLEAQKQYEAIIEAEPGNIDAILGLAKIYYQNGDPQQAIKHFQSARELGPAKIPDEDFIIMGQSFLDVSDYNAAIETFQKIKNHTPKSLTSIGKGYYMMGEFEEAARWFDKVKALDSQSVESRLFLGRCFYRLKMYQQAIDEYLGIIERFPEDLDVYLELGTASLKLEKYEEAIAYYQKALQYHPDSAKLHFSLGVTYHAHNDLEAALEEYHKAIELEADHAEAMANLGLIYYNQQKWDVAKEIWLRSLKINPDQPLIQSYLLRLGLK
ncbi:tetratricopeptide repeat protein [bacterium]|nr:tetratricopeptide repeat protein [bacterium]